MFEELDAQHQREFIEERTDAEVAGVLARMESDDAVDMLGELDEERRERILALLPPCRPGGCARWPATTRPRPAG